MTFVLVTSPVSVSITPMIHWCLSNAQNVAWYHACSCYNGKRRFTRRLLGNRMTKALRTIIDHDALWTELGKLPTFVGIARMLFEFSNMDDAMLFVVAFGGKIHDEFPHEDFKLTFV